MSQPVDVYPYTVTRQPASHSDGSFGTVFIVLAVIVVVSAIACFLGRLCSRRYHQSKAKQNHTFHPKEGAGAAKQSHKISRPKEGEAKQSHKAFRPKEGEARQNHTASHPGEGDIEFGFDKGIPASKMGGNGNSKGPKLSENGDQFKAEVRFAHDG